MDQSVQSPQPARVCKHIRSERSPIDPTIRPHQIRDLPFKLLDRPLISLGARFEYLVPQVVHSNEITSEICQRLPNETLPAGQSARKPDTQHLARTPGRQEAGGREG